MESKPHVFEDMAKMMGGAFAAMTDNRRELERLLRTQLEKCFAGLNLVTREEFEVVRDMAQKAREENEKLRAELNTLKSHTHD